MALEINERGTLVAEGVMVGRIENDTIVLNSAWLKMAGLDLVVYGDPETDRRKVLLDSRPKQNGNATLASASNAEVASEPS